MPDDRIHIHEQIFQLCYHSQGAFNQDIVYNLPVPLRMFYFRKLIDTKERENEQIKNASKTSSNGSVSKPPTSK